MGQTFPRGCAMVQLVELDVSVLGLPIPLSSCGLVVLRCLDDDPLGVLLVQQLQILGQALKAQSRQLGTGWQSKHKF